MAWARIDDGFHDHPKVLGLVDLGPDGLAALGLWTLARTWTCRHRTNGHLPLSAAAKLVGGSKARAKKLGGILEVAGLFDPQEAPQNPRGIQGWSLHDSHHYDAEGLSEKRAAAGRKGAASRWGSDAQNDGNLPPDANSNPDSNTDSNTDGKPDSSRTPARAPAYARPVPSRPDPIPTTDRPTAPEGDAAGPEVGRSVDPRLTELAARLAVDVGPGTDWANLPPLDANDVARLLDTHGIDALAAAAKAASFSGRAPGQAKVWVAAFRSLDHPGRSPKPKPVTCPIHLYEHPAGAQCPGCRADTLVDDHASPAAPDVGRGATPPAELLATTRAALARNGTTTEATPTPETVTVPDWDPTGEPPF